MFLIWSGITLAFANGNDDWHMNGWRHMMEETLMWIIFPVVVSIMLGVVFYKIQSQKVLIIHSGKPRWIF